MASRPCFSRSESTVTTELIKSTYTFNWRIANFDCICSKDSEKFEVMVSPFFLAGDDIGKESKWCVCVYGKSKYIHFFSFSLGTKTKKRNITCRFHLGNEENRFCLTRAGAVYRQAEDITVTGWSFSKMISIAELYEKKSTLLPNNTLLMCLQVEIHGDPTTYQTPTFRRKVPVVSTLKETFSADFHGVLKKGMHSDIKILCGDTSFPAHKAILSGRSKVFRTMFETDMAEKKLKEVDITDLGPETVRLILTYMYTGKIDIPNESSSWMEMVHGAEKYDLQEMKDYCFDRMMEIVTDETIGTLAVAASTYNAEQSTQDAIKTYCQKNIVRLLTDASFKKLLKENVDAFV